MNLRQFWQKLWPPDRLAIAKECPVCGCSMAYPEWSHVLNQLCLTCCACMNYWLEPAAYDVDITSKDSSKVMPTIGGEYEGPTDGMVQR